MTQFEFRSPELMTNGQINCEVKFKPGHPLANMGWMKFTAAPDDPDPQSIGKELHAACMAHPSLKLKPTTPVEINAAAAKRARSLRNSLLEASDWTQVVDAPQNIQEPYQIYRQALRDIPQQPGFPLTINWPTAPEIN